MDTDTIFNLLDTFMFEYGWGFDSALNFVTKQPFDIVIKLYSTLQKRKQLEYKVQTKLTAISVATAFGGKDSFKDLDKLFEDKSEKVDENTMNNQLRTLWLKMGKDPKEIDKQIKSGKVTF